ncbi:MAG: triose-phosphate isomerase [Candidatus Fermentibacteraceae bacterium]
MILPPTEEAKRVHGPVSGWLAEIAGEAYDGETSIVYGGKVSPITPAKSWPAPRRQGYGCGASMQAEGFVDIIMATGGN